MTRAEPVIGQTLGSYKITGRLGEGGMGVVYVAEHPLIGRKAAVKLLLPEFSDNKEVVDRFFNEARAATQIRHGGIVDIFDFGYANDGSAYIVMEFLDGESVTDRLRRGALPEEEVFRLSRQAASALAAAHESGIVHRDLKPDNLFVVRDSEVPGGERIKVLDFGIAKLTDDSREGVTKTRTGTMMGSPLYMAPEQCKGAGSVDHRADVYALGCVVYEMATGHVPFSGEGVGDVIAKHIYEDPAPPSSLAAVSPGLESIILRCMEKEPEARFATMNDVVAAIDVATSARLATDPPRVAAARGPTGRAVTANDGRTLPAGSAPSTAAAAFRETTLSGSASMIEDGVAVPPRGRRGLVAALAAIAVIGVAGIIVSMGGSSEEPGEPEVTAAAAPPPATGQTTEVAAGAEPGSQGAGEGDRPAAADMEANADVKRVTLVVDARPAAQVRDSDGVLLGTTPYRVQVEKGTDKIVFELEADGYRSEKVGLVPDRDRSPTVRLRKNRERRSDKKRKSPADPPPAEKKKKDKYDPFG